MTVYGNFEAIQHVFKTTHSSIWTARTAGSEKPADCCLKLLQLDDAMLQQRDTTLAQNLLVAAALQQAMGNKSEYWAPVYGLGSQGTNAFYVSRLFPRSAQTLIDNKTPLTAAELKTILLSVVDGLTDLDAAYHRSHGNLKPANILISESNKIRPGGVMLCDPDASTEDVPSLTRTPDTKAVGEILYALVTHRPHGTARWPLPKSDTWKDLGSTGRQWMVLCESLLNTVSRRGLPSLEHLRAQIEAIQPTRRRTSKLAFVVIALAAIGAAGYVKREELPVWYHQARAKVTALMTPPPVKASTQATPATLPTIVPRTIVQTSPPPMHTNPPPVLPPIPPVVPKPVNPTPVNPAAVNPTPVVQIPVVPTPAPPPPPTIVKAADIDPLKVVRDTEAPEFHSEAALAEFNHDRDLYASSHLRDNAQSVNSDWSKVMSKVKSIDTDYPQIDTTSTTGWPAGLSAAMNTRRDNAMVQAVDGAFLQERTDPSTFQSTLQRVQDAATAVANARDAIAKGDTLASQKAIAQCDTALAAFPPGDADLVDLFGPAKKDISSLDTVATIKDRDKLLAIADNDALALAVRISAWSHAGSLPGDPWPADVAAVAADQARAQHLSTLLNEAGSVDIAKQVTLAAAERKNAFYSKLHDQASVLEAVKAISDPKYASLLAKAPVWFRYDAALYVLRTTLPPQITADQKKTYYDLAGQVEAPGVQLVHDVLKAAEEKPPTLSQSGPGSVKDWQLRPGSTRDDCTYISTSTGDTLEFLRVHVTEDPDGIDCYVCTTETPVSLLQHLMKGDSAALSTLKTLNTPSIVPKPGMRLWSYDEQDASINLDDDNYRGCFVVSPSDQLPVNFVTPQASFYLSRRVGCRLPTAHEWLAALNQAKNSKDANMKGFATTGWKLRDRTFSKLLANPNRDAGSFPDDNIFLGNLDPTQIQRGASATIWSQAALTALGGSTAADSLATPVAWPLSTLQSSAGFGFRAVGDGENFAGVFHDLIGNVGEYVMDAPVVMSERVAVAPPLAGNEIVRRVNDWFSPQHLAAVSVIGGSAASPPELDPTKPYPLPKDLTMFSDVGFRLAFTDPTSLPNAQRAIIGQAAYLTAP